MVEEAVVHHVGALFRCGAVEHGALGQRAEAVVRALLVDQADRGGTRLVRLAAAGRRPAPAHADAAAAGRPVAATVRPTRSRSR